jgi:hypothetical protein
LGVVAEENEFARALFSGSEPAFALSSSHTPLPVWPSRDCRLPLCYEPIARG